MEKFEKLGFNYGMEIVNGGCDREDIVYDFGEPCVQADFLEFSGISELEMLENLSGIEAGYHAALENL